MRYPKTVSDPPTMYVDFKRAPTAKRCVAGWWPYDEEGQQKQLAAQRARRRVMEEVFVNFSK